MQYLVEGVLRQGHALQQRPVAAGLPVQPELQAHVDGRRSLVKTELVLLSVDVQMSQPSICFAAHISNHCTTEMSLPRRSCRRPQVQPHQHFRCRKHVRQSLAVGPAGSARP